MPPLLRRLLFVDDDGGASQSFVKLARAWGCPVDVASSGSRALELASRTQYAVVVCEASLADMGGGELVLQLAKLVPAPLFIMTTQRAELSSRVSHAARAQLLSLIPKPWDAEQLAQNVAMGCELYQRRSDRSDNLAGATLLVLDDNPGDAFLVEEYLTRVEGLRVLRAERLSEALRMLHDEPVHLIVSDLSLPDACGLDTVVRLRAAAPTATLVVCSGNEDEALAEQLILLGAQDVLRKRGLDEQQLVRTLRFARERKRSEERLAQMAFFDPLTGLANRVRFEEAASLALARARRKSSRLACMFIDLDGFKEVNDRLGHQAGDSLLRDVAQRMRHVFRDYDTIARLGGDEFGILLTDIDNNADVAQIASRLCDALAEPVAVDSHALYVTASVGIAVYPDVAESVPDLIRSADEAMYDSKRAGKNRFSFSPSRAAASA